MAKVLIADNQSRWILMKICLILRCMTGRPSLNRRGTWDHRWSRPDLGVWRKFEEWSGHIQAGFHNVV